MARGHLAKAGAHTSDGLLAKVNEFLIFFELLVHGPG